MKHRLADRALATSGMRTILALSAAKSGKSMFESARRLKLRCTPVALLAPVVSLSLSLTACPRESSSEQKGRENSPTAPERKEEVVVFPSRLRVDDATVNEFVRMALAQCAAGDYDAFRRLWTARQEPLPRGEFEEGWQAVQKIEVRALEKVMLAGGEERDHADPKTVYVLLVEVSLDPARRAGQREPNREIVLMLSRERDEWRLARPPKSMREWIKKHAEESTAPTDAQVPSGDTDKATTGASPPGGP
jgi:hypothetical protein